MMKKIYSFMLAALAVCAVSCQDGPLDTTEPDTPETPETGETMTFTASLAPGTKVSLGQEIDGQIPAVWNTDDKISLFDGTAASKNLPVCSETASFNEDKTKASFVVKNAPKTPDYAIYGTLGSGANYWKDPGQAGKVHNVQILQTQIAKSSNNISAAPLIAKVNGTELQFKNIAALLKVNVTAEDVNEISLVANTEAKISGEGAAYINGDGNPVFEPYEGAHNNVILSAGSDKTLSGVYYIAIAPANVTSLNFYVNGKPYRFTNKVKQFKSGEIFNLGDITDNCNGKYYLLGDDNQWSIAKAPVFVEEGEYLVARNVTLTQGNDFKLFKDGAYFGLPKNQSKLEIGKWYDLTSDDCPNMALAQGGYDIYILKKYPIIKVVDHDDAKPSEMHVILNSTNWKFLWGWFHDNNSNQNKNWSNAWPGRVFDGEMGYRRWTFKTEEYGSRVAFLMFSNDTGESKTNELKIEGTPKVIYLRLNNDEIAQDK